MTEATELNALFDDGEVPPTNENTVPVKPLSLDEITGNLDRSRAIIEVVSEAADEGQPTLESASVKAARFGDTFDPMTQDEFDASLAVLKPKAPDADEPSAMTLAEAQAELKRRVEALHALRNERMVADAGVKQARELLAQSIFEWSTGAPSPDQIRKNEIAAINATRALQVERRPRVLRSRLDQIAAWSAGGSAQTMVERNLQYGSHRPVTMPDGSQRFPGRRGAKLPSER